SSISLPRPPTSTLFPYTTLFRSTGMGFVLVQHLDPDHESALAQILARVTSMPVREVANDLRIAPNHVYIIPPNTDMAIAQGVLRSEEHTSELQSRFDLVCRLLLE